MKKRNQSTTAPNPISARGGLWFHPAPATVPAPPAPKAIEPKTAAASASLHAWEMTLEQFQQMYFPGLVAKQNETQTRAGIQRDAA